VGERGAGGSERLRNTLTLPDSIKLMIFGGCNTATSYLGRGNDYTLPRVAVFSKGVDAAVGWTAVVGWPEMDTWTQAFFQYNGTFFNSAVYAENQTMAMYGTYSGTDSSVWYGNWNLYVRPAGYGN